MTALETALEIHPLAHLLPSMREDEFAELKEDIAANGLHEPITLYEGKVLDGRHRYRACEATGIAPSFTTYEGDAPAAYVLSLNVKRRQLTPSQKAMLATDFLPHLEAERRITQRLGLKRGVEPSPLVSSEHDGEGLGRSRERAAEQIGVSHAQIGRAKRIKRDDPELAERVRQGEVTVTAAYEQVAAHTTSAPATPKPNGNGLSDRSKRRPQQELVENIIAKLLGISSGLDYIDTAAAIAAADVPLTKWDKDLTDIIVPLNRLRGDIRKVLSDE